MQVASKYRIPCHCVAHLCLRTCRCHWTILLGDRYLLVQSKAVELCILGLRTY